MYIYFVSISIVFVVGFLSCLWELYKTNNDYQYTVNFQNSFRRFGNELLQGKIDNSLYEKLIKDSYSMQTRMGSFGLAYNWQLPYSNVVYKEVQIIINLIPLIVEQRTGPLFQSNNLVRAEVYSYLRNVDEALLRYTGFLEEKMTEARKNTFKLIVWVREGIRFFIKLPFLSLKWFGLLPDSSYIKITDSTIVKFIGFFVALIGFVSAIVTIVTGYDPFMTIIKTWMRK